MMSTSSDHDRNIFADIFLNGTRPYLWIILTGLLLYSRAVSFGFSFLDDNILILENQEFLGKLSSMAEAFRQDVFHNLREYDAAYRPILTVSFIIDAQLDRLSGLGYHFSNIICHITASCLVFLFFLKLKYNRPLAFSFALIFAVHPVLTQAVAWIPGRNDSMLGMFVLASFIALAQFLERDKPAYLAGHIIFFALAIFTKETALAILPVSVCYYLLLVAKKPFRTNVTMLLAGWLTVSAAWFTLRAGALSDSPAALPAIPILRDIIYGSPAVLSYLGKTLLPINLSIIPTIKDTAAAYGAVSAAAIIAGLCVSKKKRYNFIAFGLIWYLSFLVPTFIRPEAGQSAIFLEPRMYLPILGIFMISGEIDVIKNISFGNKRTVICAAVIIGLFFRMSFVYAGNFKDATAFWECAAKRSPHSSLAQYNLGWIYNMRGRPAEAESRYRKSLEINPRQRYAHNSLGNIYESRGELKRAETEYLAEIENTPYYEKAYSNLANLYYRQDRPGKALEVLSRALRFKERAHLKSAQQNP